MKAYFLCSQSFALRADGNFLGNFFDATAIETHPCFIEILPHDGCEPISFFLNESVLQNERTSIFSLKDGLLFKFFPTKKMDGNFSVIYQNRFFSPDALVTVYRSDHTRIVVENAFSVETVCAPGFCKDFSAKIFDGKIAVFSLGTPSFLSVFSLEQNIEVLFSKIVKEFSFTPVFRTKTRLFDIEDTVAECEWDLSTHSARVISLNRNRKLDRTCLPAVRRAFFERILYRANPEELLNENLKPHAEMLTSFLGNFNGILPDFCAKKGVYLTYDGKDKRQTKLFDIQLENGFVTNVEEA